MKLVLSICHDNNYKIRRDGVLFLKDYFQHARETIIKSDRFEDVYLPELFDFVNDEDMHIQIDAIEAFIEIIDELEKDRVDTEFVPCFLNFLDQDNDHQIEILERIASLFGPVLYKLSKFDLHIKYKN